MIQKCFLTGAMCAIAPGSPIQLLCALVLCMSYLLLVLHAGPYKGNLEDRLAFLTSLSLSVSLLFGLTIIMDKPDNPVFDLKLLGIVLIIINVLPFLFIVYASVQILRFGPNVGVRLQEVKVDSNDRSTPEHQKNEVHMAQRQPQGRLQRRLSLANVEMVVNTDKAERVEKRTAEHRAKAIKKIKEREKQADNRVRQRLLERRNKNGTKQNQKMKRQVKQWQVEPTDNNATEVNQVKQQLVQIVKTKQRLNNAFNKLDLDKNGVLSKNEFIRMIVLLLKTKLRRDVMDCCWQAAWGLRKHGRGDEMDAGTVAHWLEMK